MSARRIAVLTGAMTRTLRTPPRPDRPSEAAVLAALRAERSTIEAGRRAWATGAHTTTVGTSLVILVRATGQAPGTRMRPIQVARRACACSPRRARAGRPPHERPRLARRTAGV